MAFSFIKRSICCILAIPLIATHTFDPFEIDSLNVFYDLFVCDEKNIVETVDLSESCSGVSKHFPNPPGPPPSDCGQLLSPPAIPSVPLNPDISYLPFLLVNNTGQPDSEVYFLIYGNTIGTTDQNFISFGFGSFTDQQGTRVAASTSPPGNNSVPYSYSIQDVKNFTGGQALIYIPHLSSGIMLYSIGGALNNIVSGAGAIAIPIATDSGDTNYDKIYAGMEVTFFPANYPTAEKPDNQVTVDFTCVDYFGFPIYFNLHTDVPAPGIPSNRPSGIYQSRHYVLCSLQNALAKGIGNAETEWNSLILKNGSTILRVVSPGYAMTHTGGTFDANYFNNAANYDEYSWANNVWNGTSPYYGNHQFNITVGGDYGTVSYTASSQNEIFVFSSSQFGNEQFNVPWLNAASTPDVGITGTTAGIMNVQAFMPGMTYQNSTQTTPIPMSSVTDGGIIDRATKITEYFSASISVGLLPGKVQSMSTSGYPLPVIAAYYTNNPYLSSLGQSTGPWYDLYSLGLLGNTKESGNAVYAYAYDDYLYNNDPTLQVAPSQAGMDPTTYITVFLGPYAPN